MQEARGKRQEEGIGVLLMAYGGPDSLEDVESYLADVTGGRKLPPPFIEEIRERYRLIGGKSPLKDICMAQAAALEENLNRDGGYFRVYVGMRHWHPYIKDTVRQIAQDSVRRVIALCMSPYYSKISIGAYFKKLADAQTELGIQLDVTAIESWNDHPLLLEAFAEKVRRARDRFTAAERGALRVLFTAHSLPEHILAEGDPYDRELRETIAGIIRLVGPMQWDFAYQSQGRTPEPWLGPKVEAVLERLHGEGHRQILIVPVGFVCDHIEVLYDVDILFRKLAASKGMHLERTDSLNTSPLFIETLAAIVRQHV
jgi:ferrochelatase